MEGHCTNVTQMMIKKEENIACLAAGDLKQPHHTSISISQYVLDDVVFVAWSKEQKLVKQYQSAYASQDLKAEVYILKFIILPINFSLIYE